MTTGSESRSGLDVAIIGLAGRFPGADSVERFWRNLCAGTESISMLDDGDLLAAGVAPSLLARSEYVRARAVLEGIDLFDAELFGYTPREAAALDPQHRLFLECAWEVFENAGYDPERAGGRVGVYAGSSLNGYLFHVFGDGARMESAADLSALLALDKDYLTTRVSYKLNLEGPSVAVQTACSTSLVAVHLACQALINGECELAVAGGASIAIPQMTGYLYQDGAIASPDGHCRAFDAAARGTVPGSGVGVVLLKRLEDALADRDSIVAVIKGSAINNDGRRKVGFTAPRIDGQARVIRDALAAGAVEPESIGYVEAHGTGTPLGDPIELAALTQAFRAGTARTGFCAIGSVKTNIGHLDAAAGVAGLIKTALALAHRVIPASLHFRAPNPAIDLAASPFHVASELTPWPDSGAPRRAGVSSFGLGGTNAHVVLEEAPPGLPVDPAPACELLVLSARSQRGLECASDALAAHLESSADLELADAAYTLQVGRRGFAHRRAIVCRTRQEAAVALRDRARPSGGVRGSRPVAFLFPGQGSQRAGACRELYETEPVFRSEVDGCAERLAPHLGVDLRTRLFPAPADREVAAAELDRTSITQPALFVLEYALARLVMSRGITPDAMIGHSIGEYVAACLADCMRLDDALALVAARGRIMENTPPGAMLAVSASEGDLGALGEGVALAAVNAPRQCVLSGSVEAIEARQRDLAARGLHVRRVRTARAFHSHLMDGALAGFRDAVSRSHLRAPSAAWVSNVTGTWITPAEAQDPEYWVQHLRRAVRFADGVTTLWAQPDRILLELGPGQTLTTLCRQIAAQRGPVDERGERADRVAVAALPVDEPGHGERAALLGALGQLWVAGASIDLARLQAGRRRRRVPLPATPFERQRYWVEPSGARREDHAAPASSTRSLPAADVDAWFYVPSWKRAPLTALEPAAPAHWLLFTDDQELGRRLRGKLGAGDRLTWIRTGARFERIAETTEPAFAERFALRPDEPDDHAALARELGPSAQPRRIVHAFCLEDSDTTLDSEAFREAQRRGLASVLCLTRVFAGDAATASLIVLASGLHDLTGRESLHPEHAPLLGLCRTLPRELPQLRCRLLDLEAARDDVAEPSDRERLAADIVAEARSASGERMVAYRGGHRWAPTVEPVRLTGVEGAPSLLRPRGVYLITGGLGGVGSSVAEYLARTVQARLVLTARSEVTDAQRAQLRDLGALGAEVLVLRADATDRAAMRDAVRTIDEHFGELNGVIHAAGIAGGGLIERLAPGAVDPELLPKAIGALVLEDVLRGRPLDFVLLCSSLTALSGGVAQAGYAAANAFLDAFAQSVTRRGGPYTASVNFDRWRHVGLAARAEARLASAGLQAWMVGGMTAAQGQQVLHRVLNQAALPQIIVSVAPLRGLPDDEEGDALARHLGLTDRHAAARGAPGASAPAAGGDVVNDAGDADALHRQMAELWARTLGVPHVGRTDDFFALGGESLLALQILNRVREVFGVEVSLRELFEQPTVAGLAERVRIARSLPAARTEPELVALPRQARSLPRVEDRERPVAARKEKS